MKVTFFRLMGYIKVLNGMGLDEITIDFSQFKNRIVLIQGENGCSKSTIIQALSPNPDTSDSFRTDVFIDELGNRQIIEYPAEKEIHYIGQDEFGNDIIYKILIKSIVDDSKQRRTTKAFISKNGEELNPNGNVSSFKEIRDNVLGIDPTYLDLSSVSAENRGIVDMIPSDRRKYMASYVGSLDTYNNIFKVISKKVNSLKSYMNTINAKISELGNENELRLQLMQLETSLKNKNSERDELLKSLAEAEATVKLVDPQGKIQDLYTSISERIQIINSKIAKNNGYKLSLSTSLKIYADTDDVRYMESELNESIKDDEEQSKIKSSRIGSLMTINNSLEEKIESDESILRGLESNTIQDNIEIVVKDLSKEIDYLKSYISEEDINILNSVSDSDLVKLRDDIISFKEEISVAESIGYDTDFISAVDYLGTLPKEIQDSIEKINSKILSNTEKINSLRQDKKMLEDNIEKINQFNSMRPAECTIDSCPYISNYIQLMSNIGSKDDLDKYDAEIDKLIGENKSLESNIGYYEKIFEILSILDKSVSNIVNIHKFTISKISSISYLSDIESIKKLLKAHYSFTESDIVSDIIGKRKMYDQLNKDIDQLRSLEGDLKIYRNNKSIKESLLLSIAKSRSEYDRNSEEISNLGKDVRIISSAMAEKKNRLEKIGSLLKILEEADSLEKSKNELREEFEKVKDNIKLVREKMDSLNNIKDNIIKIEESIDPIRETINRIKYCLTTIVEYQNEFSETSSKYEKMVFIRNACSPGNGLGIQSEYVKRYMNDIIIDCNKLLSFMFNGQIRLDIPVIDEKHFSIPFMGPNGIVVPDIAFGSTAQKCMIGLVFSCIAMMKSSTKYNIPRFDEIDGGLDQSNRITFINVLNNILDFMNSEQCIICSHNSEFDTQNTTRLICSHTGIKIEQ